MRLCISRNASQMNIPLCVYYYHPVHFRFPFGFTVSRVNRNPSFPPPHFWYQYQVLPLNLTTAYYVNGRSNARHYVLAYWHVTGNPEQLPALLSCFADHKVMERVMVVETKYSAWKADVLPLNYTRMYKCVFVFGLPYPNQAQYTNLAEPKRILFGAV